MKPAACRALRNKLSADEPVFGLWIGLEAPAVTEIAVAHGLDWVVIDAEHGLLDWKEIAEHVRATVRSETVALVRLAELNAGLVKRALDIGADGVVIPWVETAEQVEQAVRYARYPQEGVRGIGAERATAWGQALAEHAAEANDNVFVVPIIETVRAAENAAAMSEVDGVDLFWFGPADFSSSAGYRGQWEGPGVAEEILRVKDLLRKAGRHCGVVAPGEDNIRQRLEQGFRGIGLGFDAGLIIRGLRGLLAGVGRDRPMRADLSCPPPVPPRESPSPLAARRKSAKPFRLLFTGDFHNEDGTVRYRDVGLDTLVGGPFDVDFMARNLRVIEPYQLEGANGVIVLSPRVTANSLASCPDLVAIGRFGVGFDSVDVPACTAADVMLFIAAGAVDRSVAEATIGWMLALTHHVRIKDLIAREGRWEDRGMHMGTELRDRTLGVVGFGGIGKALVKLAAGFGMKPPLVYDPFIQPADAARLGACAVPLDRLLYQIDFVSVHCPLNEQTRGLIGAREIGLMKPTAYLINTARGGIVDEDALEAALEAKRIAGAGIDCFENEPLTAPPRFARFDNVLLAPHSIAWTDELFRDIGRTVCRGMLDVASGRVPKGVVNPEVLDRPGFQTKWKRICG
jgi:phosphoglycerate dehydrogenase-like enzyme/2-keto-3-deoxy-L-rhamnonate aldolase RhmA